jgi:uncharacterized protein
MAIKLKLEAELKKAMKAREAGRVSAVREILGAIKYAELNKPAPLTDQEELEVLSKLKNRHLESIESFTTGNRAELAEKERAELKVIEEFLPAMLTAEEIVALIKEAIVELGAKSMKDMGKVMARIKDRYVGRADGKAVSEEVKRQLSELAAS